MGYISSFITKALKVGKNTVMAQKLKYAIFVAQKPRAIFFTDSFDEDVFAFIKKRWN